jgi:LacI family transcriptional regulator
LQGYKAALEKNKIAFDPNLVKVVDLTEESTFFAMSQFMKMKSPPTGIFTFKNYISLDAIEFLKKKFPGKVNKIDFAGFGNLPLFRYLDHKPVASIEESSYEMGEEAARLLFQFIKDEDSMNSRAAKHIQIHFKLVVHK